MTSSQHTLLKTEMKLAKLGSSRSQLVKHRWYVIWSRGQKNVDLFANKYIAEFFDVCFDAVGWVAGRAPGLQSVSYTHLTLPTNREV